tara:strand:- start:226 stop:453 length:228 start_codon:yes stop_codon:yes gene_type:complete
VAGGVVVIEVGDLVRWAAHLGWQDGGLGTVVEIEYDSPLGWRYRIMWHVDIEDITDYKGAWYLNDEFYDETIVKV